MNTELQNKAWSVLPKEFKEEVKRLWSVEVDCATKYHSELHKHRTDLLYELFGEHLHWQNNLTSDAKSEPKFHKGDKVEVINYDFGLPSLSRCVHEVFTVSDVKYNANQWMYKLETNKWLFNERGYLESIQWCEHFLKAYKEPNPAEEVDVFNVREPKCLHFKDGKCAHPAVAHLENGKLVKGADCDVSSCEDVEYEPKPAEPKEEADEHFDTIVKGGFRDHNRLHIAAMAMQGILSNADRMKKYEYVATEPPYAELEVVVARKALRYADTLISKCEKGGEE